MRVALDLTNTHSLFSISIFNVQGAASDAMFLSLCHAHDIPSQSVEKIGGKKQGHRPCSTLTSRHLLQSMSCFLDEAPNMARQEVGCSLIFHAPEIIEISTDLWKLCFVGVGTQCIQHLESEVCLSRGEWKAEEKSEAFPKPPGSGGCRRFPYYAVSIPNEEVWVSVLISNALAGIGATSLEQKLMFW